MTQTASVEVPAPGPKPDEFYIPATVSLQERRTRTLKSGDTFAVFDAAGDVLGGQGSSDGVYHRDIPPPVAARHAGRRRAPDAAVLDPARRQRRADLRPRQPRPV